MRHCNLCNIYSMLVFLLCHEKSQQERATSLVKNNVKYNKETANNNLEIYCKTYDCDYVMLR